MSKAAWLLALTLLLAGWVIAQTNSYPAQNPPATQASPPQNPTNPSTQMPPDSAAPPPEPEAGAPPQQSNEPVLGARPQAQTQSGSYQLEAGTEIQAMLDTPLSTKTAKPGEQFTATVAQPVRDRSGAIAIPAGSKIHGEVTESQPGKTLPAIRGEGKLNLRFRSITLPDGTTEPIMATLQSVHETKGGTAAKTNEEGEVQGGTKGSSAAKDVGIGAGAGTVAGLIFGHALRGLAIGAVAGGGYVLATQGKEVTLPAETGMVLKLDHPLSLPAGPQRQ